MKVTGMYRRIALIHFDFRDLPAGGSMPVLRLPNGSRILAGSLTIDKVSNAAGTDTVALGITGNTGRNMAATSAKAAATTAFTATTWVEGDELLLTRALGSTPGTAGTGYAAIEYLYPYGCDFNVGDLPNPNDLNGST